MDAVDSPGVDGGGATLWGKDPDSDQGTHFMGHETEAWADKNDRRWHFPLRYNAPAARLSRGMNGPLNPLVKLETRSLDTWTRTLTQPLRAITEHPRSSRPSACRTLTQKHLGNAIQVQLLTTEGPVLTRTITCFHPGHRTYC